MTTLPIWADIDLIFDRRTPISAFFCFFAVKSVGMIDFAEITDIMYMLYA